MSRKYIKNCTGVREECGEKSHFLARLIFYVLLAVFLGVLIFVLFFSSYLQISHIFIDGVHELKENEIKNTVWKSMEGKYVSFLPKNNYLFISERKIDYLLKDQYKKIRSVEIEKKFPDYLRISISERKSVLVWCANDNECYLIDENGVAYAKADFNSQELIQNHLLKITDKSGENVHIGEKIMSSGFEEYLVSLKEKILTLGVEVDDQFSTTSRMSEEIFAKTIQGTEFYLSTQFPMESALKTLSVVFKKELPLTKLAEVEYIDARSENKIFYKLKQIQASEQTVDSQTESRENENKNSEKKK